MLSLGPTPTAVTATLGTIPSGIRGTRATLRLMAKIAREGKKSLPVRLAAQQLTQHLSQKDFPGEVEALFGFVQNHIRYVRDIVGVETLQTPDKTLQLKSGDCDDKAVLLASLLCAIGHPARFHAIGFRPGQYSHVFVDTRLGGGWVSLETTEPWAMGRAPVGRIKPLLEHV